ncbi:MAG: DNA replication/repair protein RecF [Anaerolineaceae bacterium]|nr:DNA replication/repair protein RecF [Anaerolineaceae bacterium]
MLLTRLSLTNYRVFNRLDLEVPPSVILISGSNAQGKTSILEAVAYLAGFASFHTPLDRQLVNFNLPPEPLQVGRILAEFEKAGRKHSLEVRLILEFNGSIAPRYRRELLLDGLKKSVNELYGQFNAVCFLPQMSKIIEDSPAHRRQYLDQILSQVHPGYARHLHDYHKALAQRNALLKILAERGGEARQLEIWDEIIARHGAEMMAARIQGLDELAQEAAPFHVNLTRGQELLRLDYRPSYEPVPSPKGQRALLQMQPERSQLSVDELETGFRKALIASHREDIARGMSALGPHRDDFRFLGNAIDLGDFGSRGQIRTALLSLKLAELQWMKQRTGEWPVLLLDEIMAELDPQRRNDLMKALGQVEQALLTSTDPQMFGLGFVEKHQNWIVENGMISRMEA